MSRHTIWMGATLLIGALALAACGAPLPPAQPSATQLATEAPTVAPTAAPQESAPPADVRTPEPVVPTAEAAMDASVLPPVALEAQQQLARRLEVDPQSVSVLSAEAVDWPDSCLGASDAGEMCAAVITPGFNIVMDVGGKQYILHTNADGSDFRVVDALAPQTGDPVIRWMSAADVEPCTAGEIGLDGIAHGGCSDAELVRVPLAFSGRPADLDMLRITYAPFSASTPAGDIVFTGDGSTIATEAEQRMIAERALAAVQEAQGGVSAVGHGLALQLYQEGGIAALCQNVSVYLGGFANVADCAAQPVQTLPVVLLDSDQLAQLYAWSDNLAPFETQRVDGTADVMTTTVSFLGSGQSVATTEMQQAMELFAQDVAARARVDS